MKQNLHPKWNHQAVVTCGCGATFTTGSGQDTITVDICSSCHPFFTGEMKFVDRQGRVDKFQQRMQAAQGKRPSKKNKKAVVADDAAEPVEEVTSYKQLLQNEQTKLKARAKAA